MLTVKNKTGFLLLIFALLVGLSSATLDFRTENPINFHSSQNLQGNDITNLNLQVFNNSEDNFIRVKGSGAQPHTLQYEDRGLSISTESGRTLVLDQGENIRVPNGNLNLEGNRLGNLSKPIASDDAVRLQFVSGNFVNRSGDTLNGSLDLDGNNIILRGGYLSNDGDNEGVAIGNNGDVVIPAGDLNISSGQQINLGSSAYLSQKASGQVILSTDGSGTENVTIKDASTGDAIIVAKEGGNVNIPNGDIKVSGKTDGIDLDDPGNAISTSGNQYVISSGDIGSNEIGSDAITSSGGELASSVAGNQLEISSGSLDVLEGSTSGLNADQLDGTELSNIDWSDVAMDEKDVSPSEVSLSALSTGSGLSGSDYDGTSSVSWSVDWSAADDLGSGGDISDGSVENAELNNDQITLDLGSSLGGGTESVSLGSTSNTISVDWSDANDLTTGGEISDNSVENAKLSNSQVTVAGNSVSLGGSTGISHGDLSGISRNDHHGLGDDLSWDSNNDPRLSNTIDVNNLDVSSSFKFPVGSNAY